MSSLTDKDYKYRNAEQSRKPGYLAKRFSQIRRELAEKDAQKAQANVTAIKRVVKK